MQAPLSQHVLELAPRRLTLLGRSRSAGARSAADRVNELFVTRVLFGLGDELLIEIARAEQSAAEALGLGRGAPVTISSR